MKIAEMNIGQLYTADLIMQEASIRKTKAGKPYLQCTLSDGTETLDGKIWNYDVAQGVPDSKVVYTVTGLIGVYQGRKQITLDKYSISANQDISRFLVEYMPDREHLWTLVTALIDTIKEPTLHRITHGIYTSYKHTLLRATSASSIHHVGLGGNLQHSYEVALYCDKICKVYNEELLYEGYHVNRDLCVAGALLHDIGKAWCYDQSTPAITINEDGRWMDHIIMGTTLLSVWCTKHCIATEPDWLRVLCHIIASHHGEPEKGSPVYPNFIEAAIVNKADALSATVNNMLMLNRKAEREGKEVTDKAWTLGNHALTLQRNVTPEITV